MNKLYEEQKHSLYQIQKAIGVGHDTLYKYYRGENKIDTMPIKMVLDIAYFEGVEVNKLYKSMIAYETLKAIKTANKTQND